MSSQLLEIEPIELKFTFEVKKQSSCAVHLTNNSDEYIAFKVKTTSPKKYCVRPNVGVIKPKSTCDFTVTMQAQRSAPPDLQCKDKFLIQSSIVPFGTTEEDITPGMFAKDISTYIQENKLKVVLISPPNSPVLLPINGVSNQEPSYDTSIQKDKLQSGVENLPPTYKLGKNIDDPPKVVEDVKLSPPKDVAISSAKDVEDGKLITLKDAAISSAKDVEDVDVSFSKVVTNNPAEDVEGTTLKLTRDIEGLKLKIYALDSKLIEAESTISKLEEEKRMVVQEKRKLKQELVVLRRQSGVSRAHVGFPPLFVCMVALIGLTIGYLLRR